MTALSALSLPTVEDVPTRPRRTRTDDRRRQLVEAAVALIQERGFEALSVGEVAQRAGMSIGGMYRYIRTKSDLLVMACEDIFAGLRERMLEGVRGAEGLELKLAAAIRIYWSACHERAKLILLTYREYLSLPPDAQARFKRQEDEIAELFRDLIRAGVIADAFRPVDERVLAHEIILLAHMSALKGWALRGTEPEAICAEHLELIFSRLRCRSSDVASRPAPAAISDREAT